MRKTITLLTLVAVVLAIGVIELRHRSRVKFSELQELYAQRDALNVEWGRLLLEQGAWADHRRVEGIARTHLGMMLPAPEQVVVIYGAGAMP